jgi:hypothetical protein
VLGTSFQNHDKQKVYIFGFKRTLNTFFPASYFAPMPKIQPFLFFKGRGQAIVCFHPLFKVGTCASITPAPTFMKVM